MDGTLRSFGFSQSEKDHSLYFRHDGDGFSVVGVYVDDLTLAFQSKSALIQFKKQLCAIHPFVDLGELTRILNIEVKRDRTAKTITLTQEMATRKLLEKWNMQDCKPNKLPISPKLKPKPINKNVPTYVGEELERTLPIHPRLPELPVGLDSARHHVWRELPIEVLDVSIG